MPSEEQIDQIKTRLDELSKEVAGLVDSVKKERAEAQSSGPKWESAAKNALRSEIGERDGVAACLTLLFREAGNEGYWFRSLRDDSITSYPPEQIVRLLAPLSNEQRLRILKSLSGGTRTSAELSEELDVKGGPLYHHLRELMDAGYVKSPNRNAYLLTLDGWFALMMATLLTSLLEGDEAVTQLVVKQPRESPAETEVPTQEMPGLIGKSEQIQQLKKHIRIAAKSNLPVLITGEGGTGKELVARLMHSVSDRASGPFIAVNCAALSEELSDSELFGHEKGAFTGATRNRLGLLERADGGTLLLDAISEAGMSTQARFLSYIESGTFRRIGSDAELQVDVKVIAVTTLDLTQAVKDGKFRDDLYYRLNVMPIHIPPLREHKDDIPLLVEHFLTRAASQLPLLNRRFRRGL